MYAKFLVISFREAVSEANKYYVIESTIALAVSFVLNLFVVSVFANGLYGTTYRQAYNTCVAEDSIYAESFNVEGTDE